MSGEGKSGASVCLAEMSGEGKSGASVCLAEMSGEGKSGASVCLAEMSGEGKSGASGCLAEMSGVGKSGASVCLAEMSGEGKSGASGCLAEMSGEGELIGGREMGICFIEFNSTPFVPSLLSADNVLKLVVTACHHWSVIVVVVQFCQYILHCQPNSFSSRMIHSYMYLPILVL